MAACGTPVRLEGAIGFMELMRHEQHQRFGGGGSHLRQKSHPDVSSTLCYSSQGLKEQIGTFGPELRKR
jgi:hypothetical protein